MYLPAHSLPGTNRGATVRSVSGQHTTSSRRRTRRILAALGVVVLAVVGVGVALTLRDNARPVSVDEAQQRAATSTTADDDGGTSLPRPAAGVYRYRGEGDETLSTPPLSQSQGPTMPGTVEWSGDGCWTFRIDFSSNHWQAWDYCPDGELVVETGGRSWQRWMIGATAITNLSTFDCDPGTTFELGGDPAGQPTGRPRDATCNGTNEAVEGTTVSSGTTRTVGVEQLEIGGRSVPTVHVVAERIMTGAQTGTERTEAWFALDSGLPVRNERTIEAATDTPIGSSSYTEQGVFELESLEPA